MELHRVFLWDGKSRGSASGGSLFVPRAKQGAGRHDIPERDGVLYGSAVSVAAVAEAIKSFRGGAISNNVFRRLGGLRVSLATLELEEKVRLIDLDDPKTLTVRGLLPSQVVTFQRRATQNMARKLFDDGVPGFLWWSTLESTWKNATLFESRVKGHLKIKGEITPLHIDLPEVRQAAKHLSIGLKDKK